MVIAKQQFIALTKCFLLQFPRSIYVQLAKTKPNVENQRLSEQYREEFELSDKSLKTLPFPKRDVEEWIQNMFALHLKYNKVVDEATPYLRSFYGRGGIGNNVMRAMEEGNFDKERYTREYNSA